MHRSAIFTRFSLLYFFLVMLMPQVAQADSCALKRYAKIDSYFTDYGIIMPVNIAGQVESALLDTGGTWSFIDESYAKERNFKTQGVWEDSPELSMRDAAGNKIPDVALVPDITLAGMAVHDIQFVISRNYAKNNELNEKQSSIAPKPDQPEVIGSIGQNFIFRFDIELDPERQQVSIYDTAHCDENVVTWNSSYFVIPFIPDYLLMKVKARLNDKAIDALIDTGASRSTIDLETAKKLLGKEINVVDASKTVDFKLASGKLQKHAAYHFDTLELGDVTLSDITIYVADSSSRKGGNGIAIGMDILRNFHIYIARNNRKIFATLANERDIDTPK